MQTTASNANKVGTITCRCGTVTLSLPNPEPKFRCGCCCADCLQRAYVGAQGQPPKAIRELQAPVDLLYVDSLLMPPSEQTRKHLALFKLNGPDAENISLRANCCGSVLCTENQAFHVPYTMATFNNLQPQTTCFFDPVPKSSLNIFTKDWPAQQAQALKSAERSQFGAPCPQIADPKNALDDQNVIDLINSFQMPAAITPDDAISFAELRRDMTVQIEPAFFQESRTYRK